MPDKNYLCFEAIEDTTIAFAKNGTWPSSFTPPALSYSIDNGSTWQVYTYGNTITLLLGNKCYWKGVWTNYGFCYSSTVYANFTSTGKVKASGNIMSLIDETCTRLDIPNAGSFFAYMFRNCSNLITPPELPATTLRGDCYRYMFGNSGITEVPALPCTDLTGAANCYYDMFYYCQGLTFVPKDLLPATTLSNYCYYEMFGACHNLATVPDLPATIMTSYCYSRMFYNCWVVKVSITKTSEYWRFWRIPTSGTLTTASNWNTDMITGTGGTRTSISPTITDYYVSQPYSYKIILGNSTLSPGATTSGLYESNTPITVSVIPNAGYLFKDYLLKGYTRLEYIESSGTQYIDLNNIFSSGVKGSVTIMPLNSNSGKFFGAQSGSTRILLGFRNNRFVGGYGSYSYSNQAFGINNVYTIEFEALSSGIRAKYNDTDLSFVVEASGSGVPNLPSYIFADNSNGSIGEYQKCRIYSLKLYSNNTNLEFDLIPVIRHSDGQIGLLDLVELKFYGNQGTDDGFIPGPVWNGGSE